MTARFVITDPAAYAKATAALPAAARLYATRAEAAVRKLRAVEDGDPVTVVLDALAAAEGAQTRMNAAKAEIVLLLAEAGASHRTIASATRMHYSTVKKLVIEAQAARDGVDAEAQAEADRVADVERRERDRARQEREAQEYSDQLAAEYRAQRESR